MLYSTPEPLEYHDPIETFACMTDRQWYTLSRFYGYGSFDELCSEIPADSAVLDIGAGASNLGHAVTEQRPDIDWVNFDARYDNPNFPTDEQTQIEELQQLAAPNLRYEAGNILDLPTALKAMSFSRIFSYYMFPHVIDYFGKETASDGMENAIRLLEPGGRFSMGPIRYLDDGCWTITKPAEQLIKEVAADMITRYTEPWEAVQRRMQNEDR